MHATSLVTPQRDGLHLGQHALLGVLAMLDDAPP